MNVGISENGLIPGGYGHDWVGQLNHRVIGMQHRCIEPLGESKPDYQIFQNILMRLGHSAYYTQGHREIDWVKRMFDASDLPKGYFMEEVLF